MPNVTINIPIPSWIYSLKNLTQFFNYHLNPPRCSICRTKLPFGKEGEFFSAHIAIKVYGSDCLYCNQCLMKKIINIDSRKLEIANKKEWFNVENYCAQCKQPKTSYRIFIFSENSFGERIHFLHHGAWNHSHICLDCVVAALSQSKMRSGYSKTIKDRSYYINSYGLPVENNRVFFR